MLTEKNIIPAKKAIPIIVKNNYKKLYKEFYDEINKMIEEGNKYCNIHITNQDYEENVEAIVVKLKILGYNIHKNLNNDIEIRVK